MTRRDHVKNPSSIARWWNEREDLHRQLDIPLDRQLRPDRDVIEEPDAVDLYHRDPDRRRP